MSELDFESRLGGQLRAYSDRGVRPIDRYAIAESTVAAGSRRRPVFRLGRPEWLVVRSPRRMALILVAMATVLAIAGSALLFGAGKSPGPSPSLGPASPTPTSAGPTPAVSDLSRYEAIQLRPMDPVVVVGGYTTAAEIDVVAMRANGQERLVSHVSSSILPAGRGFRMGGRVTEDGWLSMPTFVGEPDKDFAYALIDLAHPAREPVLVPSVLTGAWGPGGLFASTLSGRRIVIVDAKTGSGLAEMKDGLVGGGPSIVWAADGSGLLVGNAFDQSGHRGYGIVPIGGGPATIGVPPLLTFPRIVGADGAMLCVSFFAACGTSDGTVRTKVQTPESGTTTIWYSGELAPASLVQASFSRDGSSIWLLLDRMDGLKHVAVIARAVAPGTVEVVSTVDLGPDYAPTSFSLAPDDSILELATKDSGGNLKPGPHVVVTTADGASHVHLTGSSGFVLRSLTATWPGGATISPTPDATAPSASPSGQ